MNKDDNTTILTEPIVKFFRGKNFGFLGTINKDGSPQITPTWIDIIEKEENKYGHEKIILINTAMDRLKQKNVSRPKGINFNG